MKRCLRKISLRTSQAVPQAFFLHRLPRAFVRGAGGVQSESASAGALALTGRGVPCLPGREARTGARWPGWAWNCRAWGRRRPGRGRCGGTGATGRGWSRWRRSHAKALFAANRDDDGIGTICRTGRSRTRWPTPAWVVQMAGKADPLFFAVIDREKKQPAGVASLMRIAPEAGSIEVGETVLGHRPCRGRGRESEAIYLFADWVFRVGDWRFEWKCDALNRPSRRAAERMGFSDQGVFRQAAVVKGRNRDTAWFAMTDGDWRCLKPAWEAWLEPANFDAAGRQRRSLRARTTPCRVAAHPL